MRALFQNRIIGSGTIDPAQLLANPLNWRRHPKHQADALDGVLEKVGWVQAVLINKRTGNLVDGHLRVEVAMRRGEKEVPFLTVDLTEQEERLVLATLDPIGDLAETDQANLDELLAGVRTGNDGLDALLEQLRSPEANEAEQTGNTDDNKIPDPPAVARTRTGEIWTLGQHRLLVGDCTRPAEVERLMDGTLADMVWTDPPYNVDYQDSQGRKVANDNLEQQAFEQLLLDAFGCALHVTKPGGPIYVAHADSEGLTFRKCFEESGWSFRQCLIWVKDSFTLGRQDYQWQHEPVLYGWRPGEAHRWYGERDKATVADDDVDLKKMDKAQLIELINAYRNAEGTTVSRFRKPKHADLHPTMKPVELVKHHVRNSSERGDAVLDMFGGSGTTLIACQALARKARLLEKEPVNADVIITRWQQWTGDIARREDGKTYAELKP